ncbi:MAG: DUF4197 domain-containing protein [Pseudomonadota bacterium]
MKTCGLLLTGLLVWSIGSTVVVAGWSDYLDNLKDSMSIPEETTSGVSLTDAEMISGLKEALDNGTQFAVDSLGKTGGFLDNSKVKIPMPDSLSWVEKSLRTLRQDELADEFIATMNHAAEQAVPEAATIFGDAIQDMSMEDARGILTGPDDSATQYFRTKTEAALTEKMRPIVEQATARTGVTSAYKNMTASAGGLTSMLSSDATDLDGYVTGKTLDGLFLMIAEEEKKIRENPLARSTDLLKKVFGAYE